MKTIQPPRRVHICVAPALLKRYPHSPHQTGLLPKKSFTIWVNGRKDERIRMIPKIVMLTRDSEIATAQDSEQVEMAFWDAKTSSELKRVGSRRYMMSCISNN